MLPKNEEEVSVVCKTWPIIYPAYLDKTKSVQEGRKINMNLAVEHPTIEEMSNALKYLQIHQVVEVDKCYPKDWINPGRIKYLLRLQNGQLLNPQIKSKKQLLSKIAELIPKMKSRAQTTQQQTQQAQSTTNQGQRGKQKGKRK